LGAPALDELLGMVNTSASIRGSSLFCEITGNADRQAYLDEENRVYDY
jgi:hypothetical protein